MLNYFKATVVPYLPASTGRNNISHLFLVISLKTNTIQEDSFEDFVKRSSVRRHVNARRRNEKQHLQRHFSPVLFLEKMNQQNVHIHSNTINVYKCDEECLRLYLV